MHLYRACVSAHVHVQTSFNRLLDFIVLQKASIILKGPLLFHTYGKHMAPTPLFYHRMRLLPNCRVQRNLTPACNLVDRLGLLFWKEPQNWRRRRGSFPESYLLWARWLVLWEGWTVTLNQLQVAVAEEHLFERPRTQTEGRTYACSQLG